MLKASATYNHSLFSLHVIVAFSCTIRYTWEHTVLVLTNSIITKIVDKRFARYIVPFLFLLTKLNTFLTRIRII